MRLQADSVHGMRAACHRLTRWRLPADRGARHEWIFGVHIVGMDCRAAHVAGSGIAGAPWRRWPDEGGAGVLPTGHRAAIGVLTPQHRSASRDIMMPCAA